jgi:type IV pilus assembly protein PilV
MKSSQKQGGFLLLEGLIAILIFSLGILTIIGLQAVVVKEVGESKYRMEAVQFANQLIGEMWAEDRGTGLTGVSTVFASPSGTRYLAWRSQVTDSSALPGAAASPPTVVFGAGNRVTVTIFWQQPGATAAHEYLVTTQLQ